MTRNASIKRVSKYTGITALIAIMMATGCTSISQYFKGWTITIKPATQSSVSTDTSLSLTSVSTNLVGESTAKTPQIADSYRAVNSCRK
jgi:hypothetical protein